MMLSRRRFLRDTALSALIVPIGARFQLDDGPAPSPVDYGLEIRSREEWAGDDRPKGPLEAEDVKFLLVHHTASGNDYQPDDVPGLLRSFFRFHTGPEKGWPDIAYNFLIDRYGTVWEGREGSLEGPVAGSATGGNQGFSQLVAVIGDFTDTLPPPEALDSLRRTLAWLADRHRVETAPGASTTFISRGSNRWPEGTEVETSTIAGHRDMSLTQCPGDRLYGYVTGDLAVDVTALRTQVATTTTTSTEPTTAKTSSELSPAPSETASTKAVQTPPGSSGTSSITSSTNAAPVREGAAQAPGSPELANWPALGAAGAAILAGLLALIRRRINVENHPLSESGLCPACGSKIRSGDRFCHACGRGVRTG